MADPYNIIFVFLDDVNWRSFDKMGRLSSRVLPAGEFGDWVRFPNCYVNYSLCGPSRFTALTGKYARHNNVVAHGSSASVATEATDAWGDEHVAPYWLPVALQNAGYATAAFGKMPNRHPYAKGDDYVPPGFDRFDCYIEDGALGGIHAAHDGPEYFRYYHYDQAPGVAFEGLGDTWTGRGPGGAYSLTAPRGIAGRSLDTVTAYATDFFSAQLQLWMLGEGPAGDTFHEPFYAQMWCKAGHAGTRDGAGNPYNPPIPDQAAPAARHTASAAGYNPAFASFTDTGDAQGTGNNIGLTTPIHGPSYNEADIADKPKWFRNSYTTVPTGTVSDTRQKAQWVALQAVDEMLYDLNALLVAKGWDERTVIIVCNDNGFTFGDHRGNGKGTPYEPSIRTNMFVKHPDIRGPLVNGPGRHTDKALVSVLDIAPTIAEIAGVRPLWAPDGMSLVRRIKDPTLPWRRDLRFEYNGVGFGGEANDLPTHAGVLSWYPDIPPAAGGTDATGKLWKYVDIAAFTTPSNADNPNVACAAESEMYNLEAVAPDDDERTNLIADAASATVKTQLKKRKDVLHSV